MSVSIVKLYVFNVSLSKSGNSIQHKTQNFAQIDIDISLLIIFAMVLIEYDMLLRALCLHREV